MADQAEYLEADHPGRTKLLMKFWAAMHESGIKSEWDAQEHIHIKDLVALLAPASREMAANVALDGDTRRCCNNPNCNNDWPCKLHPDAASPGIEQERLQSDNDAQIFTPCENLHTTVKNLAPMSEERANFEKWIRAVAAANPAGLAEQFIATSWVGWLARAQQGKP